MDWQLIAVSGIVLVAAGYLLRQTWRTWSGRKAGCGGCGCAKEQSANATPAALIPAEQLRLRRRTGA
jgi:hypothetical protein